VIGEDNVAVPSHLYKVILARRSPVSTEPLALGAFVVPNDAIGFQPQLSEFQMRKGDQTPDHTASACRAMGCDHAAWALCSFK